MKKIVSILILGIVIGIFITSIYPNFQSYSQRRAATISDIDSEIAKSVAEGNYRCCIAPACTMCYLGDWIWDDGICRCDDMIAQGQDDKVCPQCKKGLEEGKCKYSGSDAATCII